MANFDQQQSHKQALIIVLYSDMVLLLQKIFHSPKLPSKLENHHHQSDQAALSASLQSFRSGLSKSLNQLSSDSKPGSEFLSLPWIQHCLGLLPTLNKAFAKLAVEIEYPINKWENHSVEKHLSYSLKLLDLLNSISCSISHLGHARVSISHALSLVGSDPRSAIERLGTAIRFENPRRVLKVEEEEKEEEIEEMNNCSGKELVFHEALEEMKRIGFWVCGVVLFGLSGDLEPYSAMEKERSGFPVSSLVALDLSFSEAVAAEGGKAVPRQLREVKEAAACLDEAMGEGKSSGGAAAKELERKLEVMEEMLDGIGKEADDIFSEVLAGRNELIDVLRQLEQ